MTIISSVYTSHKEHLRSYHEAGEKLAKFIKHRKGKITHLSIITIVVNLFFIFCSSFGRGGEKSKEGFC